MSEFFQFCIIEINIAITSEYVFDFGIDIKQYLIGIDELIFYLFYSLSIIHRWRVYLFFIV